MANSIESTWNNVQVIDQSAEAGAMRNTPVTPLLWSASDINRYDWKVELNPEAVEEIKQVVSFIDENPHVSVRQTNNNIRWPAVTDALTDVKDRLDNKPGFAVLHGLPIDDMSAQTAVDIYWLLGLGIAPPVAQKWDGEMIYSVRDTGQSYGYGVRGSRTSVELVFHVDNAFGLAVPDYVGLLCKQPAKHGGISRFCSLYTVHDMLYKQYPEALKRLCEPMLFDRQKEHDNAAPQVLLAPFFSWRKDKLFARANTSLVRKGYEVAQISIDSELEDALNAVTDVCKDQSLWYEAPLERGHIQYLNNHEIAHYRSEFEDFEESEKKRHLYRLWHRTEGSASYDGEAGASTLNA